MYDIVIAYRCYPNISKKPFLRANDKLGMICGWLSSMVRCLWDLKAKIYIIDDWCPITWEHNIKKLYDDMILNISKLIKLEILRLSENK